ncbi:NAD(+)/NADH kinase [Halorhabdus amylolytica]|uniref:NAD(+)/NADH kinase n=1 Tax=Halorhabdus amylolytica TaxID=2559573 RepID=UPI0010A9DC07|nr:NAD(+)/NADH kinase [Halorhabdus amylolytica]
MSDDPGAGPIAVVGDERGAVSELVESVGRRVRPGTAGSIDDATVVLAVGEAAVLDLARQGCSTPVMPVAVQGGLEAVPSDALQTALQRLDDGAATVRERPILAVHREGERVETALLDVMLVTSEPAHISEYAVSTPKEAISTFRADGVVVATPAGSNGYARRIGGPVLSPDLRGLSVVPVGAFKTERNHWVVSLPADGPALSMTVQREDAPVSLLVDGRDAGGVPAGDRLVVDADGHLPLVVVPESESAFRTDAERPRPDEVADGRGLTDADVDPVFPAE